MVIKKDLVIAVLATFCLTSALFSIIPTRSSPAKEYNPIADLIGPKGIPDGRIDMRDIGYICNLFGATGTPVNWTKLFEDVDELQSKVNSLNASLLELQSRIDYLETRMPKKGCISVPAVSFVPMDNSTPYRIQILRLTGKGGFFAGLQLPHGAILTNMTAYVYDAVSNGEIYLQLFGLNLTSGNGFVMAYVQSGVSETPGFTELSTDTISYAEVEEQWTYFLSVSFTYQIFSLHLAGVVIEYEYST